MSGLVEGKVAICRRSPAPGLAPEEGSWVGRLPISGRLPRSGRLLGN
jgi:hypothetical protein